MKKNILLLVLIFSMCTLVVNAQKKGSVTVNTMFTGILDGYDHINKTMVYVDGKLECETSELPQSRSNSCTFTLPRGRHKLRIINMAKYDGKWEEHTYENKYSLDALYEGKMKLRKKFTINLVFDITKEKTFAKLN